MPVRKRLTPGKLNRNEFVINTKLPQKRATDVILTDELPDIDQPDVCTSHDARDSLDEITSSCTQAPTSSTIELVSPKTQTRVEYELEGAEASIDHSGEIHLPSIQPSRPSSLPSLSKMCGPAGDEKYMELESSSSSSDDDDVKQRASVIKYCPRSLDTILNKVRQQRQKYNRSATSQSQFEKTVLKSEPMPMKENCIIPLSPQTHTPRHTQSPITQPCPASTTGPYAYADVDKSDGEAETELQLQSTPKNQDIAGNKSPQTHAQVPTVKHFHSVDTGLRSSPVVRQMTKSNIDEALTEMEVPLQSMSMEETTTERHSLHTRKETFLLSKAEWAVICPNEKSSQTRRRLQGGWTDIFATRMKDVLPGCILVAKGNRVKAKSSRKKQAHYFNGKSVCKRQGCPISLDFFIQSEPEQDTDVIVNVEIYGSQLHSDPTEKRNLKGEERKKTAATCREKGIMPVYYGKIAAKDADDLDFSTVPKPNVLRKAVSECIQREMLHRDTVQELKLLKEAYRNEDDNPSDRYAGYIQYIAVDPFTLICFCKEQVHLLKHLSSTQVLDIYIDATGKVLRRIPNQKQHYLYSVVVKPTETPPVSVCDMITTDHSVPSIAHCLLFFQRAITLMCPKLRFRKIETDWSWALIQASLLTFSRTKLKEYLNRTWNLCSDNQHPNEADEICVQHICSSHMTKTASVTFNKITRKNRQSHSVLMKCFVLLINETYLDQTRLDFRHICGILLSSPDSDTRRNSVKHVDRRLTEISPGETNLKQEEEDDAAFGDRVDEATSSDSTIRQSSPWARFFDSIKEESVKELAVSGESQGTEDLVEVLDTLLSRFLPIFPLWSGILLGPLSRHNGDVTPEKRQVVEETRDSNANVECWFRIVKLDILRNQTRLRPAEFVIKLKKSVNGRLREALSPEIRAAKKPTERTPSVDLSQERWSRGRKTKKNVYHPKRNKRKAEKVNQDNDTQSQFPAVPKWGGKSGKTKLSNTCTIDNFLAIMHVYASEHPSICDSFREHMSPVLNCLGLCLSLMKESKFTEAKFAWLSVEPEQQTSQSKGLVDLFGNEHDAYAKHFQRLVITNVTSMCLSPTCPDPSRTRVLKGMSLSCPDSTQKGEEITIQHLLNEWTKPTIGPCEASFDPGKSVPPCAKIRKLLVTDADDGSVRSTVCCAGQRRTHRNIFGVPPVIVLTVGDLVTTGYVSSDVTSYDKEVAVCGESYRLAGITLHRPGHFVACLWSRAHGWLYYDGLAGELKKFTGGLLEGSTPENIVYILATC